MKRWNNVVINNNAAGEDSDLAGRVERLETGFADLKKTLKVFSRPASGSGASLMLLLTLELTVIILSVGATQNQDCCESSCASIKVLKMREDLRQGNASGKDKDQAKEVATLLRQRHAGFKEGKLKEVGLGDKANHPVFKFCEDNFHVGAALLVAYDMVKEELDFIASDDAVLKVPSDGAFVDIEGDVLKYWGAYMYADMDLMAWIRSGKACGSTEESGRFKARILYHLKAAKTKALGNDDGKITFYQRYVSRNVDDSTKAHVKKAGVAKGYHEDLKVKVGFAIDPNSDYSSLCDGSTFVWSKAMLEYLSKKDGGGLKKLEEKQCELLCYFWEHMLELLMEKDKVVSWSAGWERYIGVGKVAIALKESMDEDDD